MKKLLQQISWREWQLAILFCLILIALVIVTASNSKTWIYQNF